MGRPNSVNSLQNLRCLNINKDLPNEEIDHTIPALFQNTCRCSSFDDKGVFGQWVEQNPRRNRHINPLTLATSNDHEHRYFDSDYIVLSYFEASFLTDRFSKGLAALGLKRNGRVAILASVCGEWFIALQACFQRSAIVIPLDTSWSEETLVHILNEAKVSIVICDRAQVQKLVTAEKHLKTVKTIIFITVESYLRAYNYQPVPLKLKAVSEIKLQIKSYLDVRDTGYDSSTKPVLPSPVDIALIMYTSGGTKGASITHKNLLLAVTEVSKIIPHLGREDIYFAHLQMSNILELLVETSIVLFGGCISYAYGHSSIDASKLLGSTLVIAAPTALDEVKESIKDTVNKSGWISKKLFNLGYSRSQRALEGSAERKLWKLVMFNKIGATFENRLRVILLSDGSLSKDTQNFVNICSRIPTIIQTDGLTESLYRFFDPFPTLAK